MHYNVLDIILNASQSAILAVIPSDIDLLNIVSIIFLGNYTSEAWKKTISLVVEKENSNTDNSMNGLVALEVEMSLY